MIMKPTRYKITPIRLVIPGVPVLAEGPLNVDEIRTAHTIRITGVATGFFNTEAARREAEQLLGDCQARFSRGDRSALIELLDANPAFIAVEWVRETYERLRKAGVPLRRRGRIRGKHEFHPLVVMGLVRRLIESGAARHVDDAFRQLEALKILEYGTAKDLYYRGEAQDRFRPILLEFREGERIVPAAEVDPVLARAVTPGPGQRLQWATQHPTLGDGEFTVVGGQ